MPHYDRLPVYRGFKTNVNESQSRVGLFLLFNVNIEKEDAETLSIEMKDDVVTNYWIDRR